MAPKTLKLVIASNGVAVSAMSTVVVGTGVGLRLPSLGLAANQPALTVAYVDIDASGNNIGATAIGESPRAGLFATSVGFAQPVSGGISPIALSFASSINMAAGTRYQLMRVRLNISIIAILRAMVSAEPISTPTRLMMKFSVMK